MKQRKGHHGRAKNGSGKPALPAVPAEPQLVEIQKPIYGGAFLARLEGKAVFVPLALPGEQVEVRIAEDKRGYAKAEVEQIMAASPERIAPGCPHFGACGGCDYQHTGYANQLAYKQAILRETLERGGVQATQQIDVLAGEPWGYRNRIRVAVDAHGNAGYRERRSHAILPIRECPIAAPLLVQAALTFAELVRNFADKIRPRELTLFCDSKESSLLLAVFISAPAKISLDDFAAVLRERIPALQGIELVLEAASSNAAESQRVIARWGTSSIHYRAGEFDYRVDNGAFFQVNRWLVDALVEWVTAGQSGKLAWDLFAGVGLFARRLAGRFERVVAVESSPAAEAALKANLSGTAGEDVNANVLAFLLRHQAEKPGMIVVDPPRTGLGPEMTTLLAAIAAPQLVYVSCDPATLARDLKALVASGYQIETIALADLFPQTFHLETIVHLRRQA